MSTPDLDELTPTSYAMLGLLAVRPWSTYELAKQMQRSVRWFWPRAERKLYDEPKRLVALGLATVRAVSTGRRTSSVYEITGSGRDALQRWLGAGDPAPLQLEMEAMIKVFFADGGTPAQLRATIGVIGVQAQAALGELGAMAAVSAAGDEQFHERRATNAVAMELCVRIHETVRDWAVWAGEEVDRWPAYRRDRRVVAAGPPQRGDDLFADIARRTGADSVGPAGGAP